MEITFAKLSPSVQKVIATVLILISFVALVYAAYTFLPVHEDANPPETWGFSVDWKGCIRPDTLKLLSGSSPYTQGCGLNPPWTYLLLAPIALLPPALGAAVMFVFTYVIYALALRALGAKPLMILAYIFCPLVLFNAQNGNIDFLPVLGMILPPWLGLFFLAIKPQIGAGLALFWIVEAWRSTARLIAPVTVAYFLSFVVFGLYPLRLVHMLEDPFNASIFPFGLLFGVPLLVYALVKRQKLISIAATPLLAPYINVHSYAVLLFAFIPYEAPFCLAVALSWLAH